MLSQLPQGRRTAVSAALALCVGVLVITVFQGLSSQFLVRGVQVVA